MTMPNLARDPFVNRRPVRRLAALLWVAAVAVLAVDVQLFWSHFSGQDRQETELEELEISVAEEQEKLQTALAALDEFDIDWQREQVLYLNAKIAERTFSWSALFDHFAEVLPRGVRVERVTPQRASRAASRRLRPRQAGDDEVILELTGASEKDEDLLVLVDAFFAHERFRRPNLRVEARNEDGSQVSFSMTVTYDPPERERRRQRESAEASEDRPPATAENETSEVAP